MANFCGKTAKISTHLILKMTDFSSYIIRPSLSNDKLENKCHDEGTKLKVKFLIYMCIYTYLYIVITRAHRLTISRIHVYIECFITNPLYMHAFLLIYWTNRRIDALTGNLQFTPI